MPDAHKNFAYSTVATAPSPATTGTSLVVETGDGTKFPPPSFNATVWPFGDQPLTANAEIVRVTAVSGDTLTIARTQESTAVRAIVVGDQIAATITAKTLQDVEALAWKTRNLLIENGATSTSQVKVTADDVSIEDIIVNGVNVTGDIAAMGANGLDTGSEAANTWYAVWLIYNPSTGTTAALMSTSFSSPTLPSGYTKKRRVGAVRNDSSSNFSYFQQLGQTVSYLEYDQAGGPQRIVNAANGTTVFQSASAASVMPPTSRELVAFVLIIGTTISEGFHVRPTGHATTVGARVLDRGVAGRLGVTVRIRVNSAQSFDWKQTTSSGPGTVYIVAQGYVDPVF